jgi:hypothetical protein
MWDFIMRYYYISKKLQIKKLPFLMLGVWKQREKLCGVLTAIDTCGGNDDGI